MDAPGLDEIILGSKSQRVVRQLASLTCLVPPCGCAARDRSRQLFRLQQSIAELLGSTALKIRRCGGPTQIYPDVVVDCVAYAPTSSSRAAVELRLNIKIINHLPIPSLKTPSSS